MNRTKQEIANEMLSKNKELQMSNVDLIKVTEEIGRPYFCLDFLEKEEFARDSEKYRLIASFLIGEHKSSICLVNIDSRLFKEEVENMFHFCEKFLENHN